MQNTYAHRWDYITQSFKDWKKLHTGFAPQITVWQKHFEKLHLDFQRQLCEHRRSKRPIHIQNSINILEQAEAEFKLLTRYEFIASLSK